MQTLLQHRHMLQALLYATHSLNDNFLCMADDCVKGEVILHSQYSAALGIEGLSLGLF